MPIGKPHLIPIPVSVRKRAYQFDGIGRFSRINWKISEGVGSVFNWYHVELSRKVQLSIQAQSLGSVLCPPLNLHDIPMLVRNGPFCDNVNGALIFRVNASGPVSSDFTLRMAARVTDNCIITVSLGSVPRLGFRSSRRKSPLSIIPSVEDDDDGCFDEEVGNDEAVVINEKLLDSLLSMDHSEEADQNVHRVGGLLVHIVDAHVHQVQDMVTKQEMELKSVKLLLDRDDSMLDCGRCLKMHLRLLNLAETVELGEKVFPRVKEMCATKIWFISEDAIAFEKLIRRLERLKGDIRVLAIRITEVRVGLRSLQANQTNRMLYFLFFCSMVFLTSSIGTAYRMNVGGGLPWTGQSDEYGSRNVILLGCAFCAIYGIFLLCFTLATAWKRRGLTRL